MRCAICDKDDEAVTAFNKDCAECQEIIYDTLASYADNDDEPQLEPEFIVFEDESFSY